MVVCGSLWGASGGIPAFAPGMASLEFDFWPRFSFLS